MNKILIGLALAIGLAVGGYALISKLYEVLHENTTLKANNQTLLEADQTNQITIDKLNALSTKVDDLNIALKQMVKEQDQNTEIAIEAIQPLKNKGGEYEILNAKYPDDPIINCVFNSGPVKWTWEELEKMRSSFNKRIRELEKLLTTID